MTVSTKTIVKSVALGALMASSLAAVPASAEEQYFPLQVYRQGPYAAGGTGFFGGMIDYMNSDQYARRRCQRRQAHLE